jgi:hypothetical protein
MNNLSSYAEEANITPEEYRYYIRCIKEIDATSLEFVEKLCQAAYERGLVTGILDANSS